MSPKRLDLKERLTRARVRVIITSTFFGTLLMRLRFVELLAGLDFVEVEKGYLAYDTMATDGKSLYYVAEYVDKLDDLSLQGLLAHEVMHIGLCHMTRRGARYHELWNVACDGAIDWILKTAGFTVPDSFADNPDCAWMKGRSAEEIYQLLPQHPPQPPQPRAGGVIDSPGTRASNPAQVAQEEQETRVAVHQAAIAAKAKARGDLPAWLKSFIDEMLSPKVLWKDHLRVFIAQHIPNGQTWARPNRRHAHTGLYLPGTLKEGIGEGVIYFDTSGSTTNWWQQFLSECNSVIEDCQPERVHVVQCDAGVGDVHTYERGDTIDNAVIGGGGSDFRPAFRTIEEGDFHPSWAIVLSDMDIAFPSDPPPYPVLMFSTTSREGPDWAPTIRIEP